MGTKALMEVLPAYGAGDEAYRVAVQTEFPSWGWLLLGKGYTTFTEAWEGGVDHTILTSVGSYFFRWLGGIQPEPGHPGFRHFLIRPTFVKDLEFVRATYRCPSGLIASRWQRHDGWLTLDEVVPPNTTATITVPAADAGMVTESGRPAAQAQGVKLVRAGDGAAVFEVQSGAYRFEMPEREKSKTAGMRN
jgi:alpha-L-rhamnosidase